MEDVARNLSQAVQLIHHPQTTPAQRQAAQKYCEDLKSSQSPRDLSIFGTLLANQSNPSIVRHFGFHLLEHIIKEKWNLLNDDQKKELKNSLLSVVANGTKDIFEEDRYVKEKIVRIVVETALREYPQRWTDLISTLFEIAKLGERQLELVLMILRTLPEDVKTYNSDISSIRRKDILTGIQNNLTFIFTFMYSYLELHYGMYLQSLENRIELKVKLHLKIVENVLSTLLSFMEWVPINLITDKNLPQVLCQLIKHLPVRKLVCENLILLITRKVKTEEKHLMMFPFHSLDSFGSALASKSNDPEEDYHFHKQLGQILNHSGLNHLTTFDNSPKNLPPNYDKFLQMMLEYLNHPSLYIASIILPYWTMAVQNKYIVTLPTFEGVYPRLLKFIESKVVKIDPFMNSNDNTPVYYFARLDFDTRLEFFRFFGTLRNNLMHFMKYISMDKPELSLEYTFLRLKEVFEAKMTNKENAIDGIQVMIENALLGIYGKDKNFHANPEILIRIESLLKIILEYETNDTIVIGNLIGSLQSFSEYYKVKNMVIPFILQKIFTVINFRQANEVGLQLSNLSVATRRKACVTLLNISHSIPSSMLVHLKLVIEMAEKIFSSQIILDTERIYILESLVEISNSMDNKSEQLNFVMKLVSSIESEWSSIDLSFAFNDPKQMLQVVGIINNNGSTSTSSVSTDHLAVTKKEQYLLHSMASIWKRSSVNAPMSHITKVIPNLLNALKNLHLLQNMDLRKQLVPPHLLPVFNIDEQTASALLGTHVDQETTTHTNGSNQDQDIVIKSLRMWLENVRDYGYILLGSLTKQEQFYMILDISKILYNSVFSNIENAEYRHIKLFLRNVVSPLVIDCPPTRYNEVLLPLLPSFFSLIFSKLNEGWKHLQASSTTAFANSEKEEVLEDKLLRDLTRELISWLSKILHIPTLTNAPKADQSTEIEVETSVEAKDIAPPTPTHNPVLIQFLLAVEEIAIGIMYITTGMLHWPDSVSFRKGLLLATSLVPLVIKIGNPKFYSLLGEMLTGALQLLSAQHLQDYRAELIGLIREIYVLLAPFSNIAQQIFLSIPKFTPTIIQNLNQQLSEVNDEKKQKTIFKTLLQDQPVHTKIPDLPERLVSFKPPKQGYDWQDSNEDTGLSKLL